MLRRFTKDIGRYKAGQEIDVPRGVWNTMAQQAGEKLEAFSQEIESNRVLSSTLKGKFKSHKRLGATQ